MKKVIVILAASLLNLQAFATVTLNVTGADLRDNNGVLMPTTGLVLLVADTLSNGFYTGTSLLPEATLTNAFNFLQGDDMILWTGQLDSFLGDGIFNKNMASLAFTGNWGPTDPLALYWFPTLTPLSTTVGALTWYGMYTTNVVLDGTTPTLGGWFTPPDASGVILNFLTVSEGGSTPNSYGWANNQTIPEPSAFMLVGMGLLGALLLHRRRS